MELIIKKSKLKGLISIPPSKSYSHRHLLMAMLSKKKTTIYGVNDGDDIQATLNVAKNLGCDIEQCDSQIIMDSTALFEENKGIMDVYASGSTLRFLIPICLTHEGVYRFYMRDRLKDRSLKVYEDLFTHCFFKREGNLLEISGHLEAGRYEIDGSHSSQFVSGIMMALPLLEGDSEVLIQKPFVSQDYFEMTLACMQSAGIEVERINDFHFKVKGHQQYRYEPFMIESDGSSAAVVKVAKYLGHDVFCGMSTTNFQKDMMIDEYLKEIEKGDAIINVKDCPDLVPMLSLAMALTAHHYQIIGASRLKDKESNRLEATAAILNQLGGNVKVVEDGLIIDGVLELHGGKVDSYNDHRMAMMAVLAGLSSRKHVFLSRAECIQKSWPTFYTQLQEAGGNLYEL